MTPVLSRLRWWHIAALAPLERDLFGDEEWKSATFWSELAQAATRYYVVATEAADGTGPVLGYAGLCVYGPRDAWVQNLAVAGSAQRRGLGRLLLDGLLTEALRRGAEQVSLEVRADNDAAQRLYARRGFEPIGLRRGYYQPSGVDAVVMTWVHERAGAAATDRHGAG